MVPATWCGLCLHLEALVIDRQNFRSNMFDWFKSSALTFRQVSACCKRAGTRMFEENLKRMLWLPFIVHAAWPGARQAKAAQGAGDRLAEFSFEHR